MQLKAFGRRFQSTLPRGERHNWASSASFDLQISIHAPARGATSSILYCLHNSSNFNPRSREGSDYPSGASPSSIADFNPRSREGSDHTATAARPVCPDFNPRSREGSDVIMYFTILSPSNFNPRSREGSDRSVWSSSSPLKNFNPRSREGSDRFSSVRCFISARFQSTLPRGERRTASTC